ncbi:MAG TPA: alpha-1,2-fucosyltransferase [Xanthobacteraceae bacterium]|nr:alpha-1,2-fucosyltransferase [Xanthobacteraceae bacterium]
MLIVVRLYGGLGNQMFQYAAARALSLRSRAEVKLDLTEFSIDPLRGYELGNLSVAATPASAADLRRFGLTSRPMAWRRRRWLRLLAWPRAEPMRRQSHFHFDQRIISLRPPVYLDGYWQSERYFADHAETLRRELVPAGPLDPANAAVAAQIDAVNAVSVHVRRGDYVSVRKTNRYHGVCSPEYYRRAIAHVRARIAAPHLFVFSDDPYWCRNNLQLDAPMTIVDANAPDRGHRDMQLMARCRHHVIANSSFSWWGAWLNAAPDKIVVAPRRWFNTSRNDTRDLTPAAWVRM